ncbi:ASCH domain-containing protein [Paraburkholderia sediminicola]|uniref:ASCH domain-containing protein n=1 Tax=Paraburkholderia sediminicola TaxID=458836 RepID=UPI0038B9AB0A
MSATILFLPLKAFYFDKIRAGRKPEEFRLASDYWRKRLVGRHYDFVLLTRGYPRADDFARQQLLPWRGYVLRTITHSHFGPAAVSVFAIDVSGERLPDCAIAALRSPSAGAQSAPACQR